MPAVVMEVVTAAVMAVTMDDGDGNSSGDGYFGDNRDNDYIEDDTVDSKTALTAETVVVVAAMVMMEVAMVAAIIKIVTAVVMTTLEMIGVRITSKATAFDNRKMQ